MNNGNTIILNKEIEGYKYKLTYNIQGDDEFQQINLIM